MSTEQVWYPVIGQALKSFEIENLLRVSWAKAAGLRKKHSMVLMPPNEILKG